MSRITKVLVSIFVLQIAYMLNAFIITSAFENNGCAASAVDSVVMGMSEYHIFTYVTIVIAFFVLSEMEKNMYYNVILRSGGYRNICFKILWKIMFFSVVLALFHVISLYIWSLIKGRSPINWSRTNSLYAIVTEKTSDSSFLKVLIYAFLGAAIGFCIISMIVFISGWMFGSVIAIFTVIFFFIVNKTIGNNILFNTIFPNYLTIGNITYMSRCILAGVTVIGILFVIEIVMMKRKEYI